MILYPAIDLKGGACVRLVRGEMASATVFNDDPAAQARAFAEMGFSWLHIVDLDGAFAGRAVNGEAVRTIRRAVDLKMQLGGGIRDRAAIVYTDIARDGALIGVDAAATGAFAKQVRLPVIASGGVAGIADIAALKARESDGITGVICGRALYDGRIDPKLALRLLAGHSPC